MSDPNVGPAQAPKTFEEFRALQAAALGANMERDIASAQNAGTTPDGPGGVTGTERLSGTTPDLIFGKFKDMATAESSHHLLMKNFNEAQAERDRLAAELAAARAALASPTTLSPGRADPATGDPNREALEKRFVEDYGMDPKDVRALVADALHQERAHEEAVAARQRAALTEADKALASKYPELLKTETEVVAFLQTNPELNARVSALWQAGDYQTAKELGWLHYDNARRVASAAASAAAPAHLNNEAARNDATMLASAAAGARETNPTPSIRNMSATEIAAMREAYKAGDPRALAFMREQIFGASLRGIPDLAPPQ